MEKPLIKGFLEKIDRTLSLGIGDGKNKVWEYYAMRILCYENIMLWEYYTTRILCYENIILWEYYTMRILYYENIMLQ